MTVIIHNSSFLVNYFYQHVESSHALHAYASFSSWVTLNLKRNKHKLNQTQRNFNPPGCSNSRVGYMVCCYFLVIFNRFL